MDYSSHLNYKTIFLKSYSGESRYHEILDIEILTRDMESNRKGSEPRTVLCFFFFGLLTMVYDEITLVAAQDVLAGSSIATTTVVLSIAFSVLSMKLTVPWVMQTIPYLVKIIIIVLVLVSGLLTLVCSSEIPVRLAGVSIIEAGVSTSEITLMSLTAFYDPITVSAFVAGIGMSSLFGPFYYTGRSVGFTTGGCLGRQRTVSIERH